MTVQKVMEIARKKKIKNMRGLKKAEIIKTIQKTEGNFDCFGTMTEGFCDQSACMWTKDCMQTSKPKVAIC